MEYLGYAASLLMGVVLGLMGGGGSILTVPILVYLFALPPMIATGYSLFVVGMTALIGSIIYVRKDEVDFRTGIAFALPSILGLNISRGVIIPLVPTVVTHVGKYTVTKEILVMLTFAVIMMAASYSMIKKKNEKTPVKMSSMLRFAILSVQGLLVGMIAGFVGAGGGFLIIPVLVFVAGLTMRMAVGTSLMVIAFQSLLGFAGDVVRGLRVDWALLGAVAIFAVVGIALGSGLSQKVKEQKLKVAFGWFVLVMGVGILTEQLRHL